MTDLPAHLHLSGELSLEVDAVGVQVHAEGSDVRIVAEDVGAFVGQVREAATARSGVAPGRRDLGGLAEALAQAGITAHLSSPTRPVAVAGAGVDSPTGGLLLGTRLVRPGAAVVVIAAGAVAAVLTSVLVRRRR